MMFIVPVVIECANPDELAQVLPKISGLQHNKYADLEFAVTGFGNILPVPDDQAESFRNQLNETRRSTGCPPGQNQSNVG